MLDHVGTTILQDNEVRRALYPVERLGVDTQLTALASVSYVECDASLDVAKCYVTVYGDERSRTAAMAGLERKKGYLRTRVGKMLQIRRTPELRFIRDDSIERGDRTLALLAKMKASGDSGDFEEGACGRAAKASVGRGSGRCVRSGLQQTRDSFSARKIGRRVREHTRCRFADTLFSPSLGRILGG